MDLKSDVKNVVLLFKPVKDETNSTTEDGEVESNGIHYSNNFEPATSLSYPKNSVKPKRRTIFCSICLANFNRPLNYEQHWLANHSNLDKSLMYNNPHGCKKCGRYFRDANALNVHTMKCDNQTAAAIVSAINNKIRLIKPVSSSSKKHSVNDRNRLVCRLCSKRFFSVDRYETHWSFKHANFDMSLMYDNPQQCKACNRYFQDTKALKMHTLKKCNPPKESILPAIHVEGEIESAAPAAETALPPAKRPFKNVGNRIYCRFCPKSFDQPRRYEEHWSAKHPELDASLMYENPHQCNQCNRYFRDAKALYTHSVQKCNISIVSAISVIDDDNEGSQEAMAARAKNESVKNYKISCRFCSQTFDSPRRYEKHFSAKHSNLEMSLMYENPHQCKICGRYFQDAKGLCLHTLQKCRAALSANEQPISYRREICCRFCSRNFDTAGRYERHFLSKHSDLDRSEIYEIPHECQICVRYFENSHALRIHNLRCHIQTSSNNAALVDDEARMVESMNDALVENCLGQRQQQQVPSSFKSHSRQSFDIYPLVANDVKPTVTCLLNSAIETGQPICDVFCSNKSQFDFKDSEITKSSAENLDASSDQSFTENNVTAFLQSDSSAAAEENFQKVDTVIQDVIINNINDLDGASSQQPEGSQSIGKLKKQTVPNDVGLNGMWRKRPAGNVCRICGAKYTHQKAYKIHFAKKHPECSLDELFDDGWKCSLCDSIFKSLKGLQMHWITLHRNLYDRESFCSFGRKN